MSTHEAVSQFEAIIRGYSDFPAYTQQAKEGLSLLQDNYLQKKIAYLESKTGLGESEKAELLKQLSSLTDFEVKKRPTKAVSRVFENKNLTDKMRFWRPSEEALYNSWTNFHTNKGVEDFYNEQKANAIVLNGVVSSFNNSMKNRPGDYVIKNDNVPIAYLYSTVIDLEKLIERFLAEEMPDFRVFDTASFEEQVGYRVLFFVVDREYAGSFVR